MILKIKLVKISERWSNIDRHVFMAHSVGYLKTLQTTHRAML